MVSAFDAHPTKVKSRQFVSVVLSHHQVTLKNFVLLAYFWAYEMPNYTAAEMLELHPNTVVQWFSYLRDAASNHLLRNPMQIGDPGRVVEIDKSVIACRKYHRGHRVPERWAFGGIDPESNLGFLVLVDNHSAATLLPLIQQCSW